MWKFLDGVSQPRAKKPKTQEQQLEVQRDYEKNKRKRAFQESWTKEFTWLKLENGEMICTICKGYDQVGSFVTGCKNFKIQTIKTHASSEGHMKNESRVKAASICSGSSEQSAGEKTLMMLNAAAIFKLRLLFSNAHFVAKMGRPYTDYVHLCKLDKSNKNLDIGSTYINDKYCQIFIKSIANSMRTEQDHHINESPFISLISDGSTDSSSKEAECIMLRSAAGGKVKILLYRITLVLFCRRLQMI
jgi:hypothetical protein